MKSIFTNQDLYSVIPEVKNTNRHLVLKSKEFKDHLIGYKQWLSVLGYAGSTVYYFPDYVRALMSFLGNAGINL